MYAVLFAEDSEATLPDDFIVEYYPISDKRPLKDPYKQKTQTELMALLDLQEEKYQAFEAEQSAKNQAATDSGEAERLKQKNLKKKIKDLDLSVFDVAQRNELRKLVKFVTGELKETD